MKKNRLKRICIVIITLLIMILYLPVSKVCAGYEISKSKKATELDENYESYITIATPINDGNDVYDFVFVLDKSTSGNDDIRKAIDDFSERLEKSGKNIKIGVVAFYNKAEIIKNFEDEEMAQVSGSGTNLSAGILLGTKMLDDDTSIPNSHKYLILISDGDTHVFNKNNNVDGEPTVIAQGSNEQNSAQTAGPTSYSSKYSNFEPPNDWKTYFEEIGKMVEKDGDSYENPYNTKGNNRYTGTDKYIPFAEISEHAVSVDKALYYSYIDYLAAKQKGYNTFSIPIESSYGRAYGPSFMKFLNDGNDISIDSLIDITYMVGPGTTVTDYIGKGTTEQGVDYEFNVIDDIANYSIKVDGIETDITKIETEMGATSSYGAKFDDGSYSYIINYYDGEDERVELIYNVIVSSIEPIELTFKVKLINPTNVSGNYTGINTNNDCIIKIIDSKGNLVGEEKFEKPIVSYTIENTQENIQENTLYENKVSGSIIDAEEYNETNIENITPESQDNNVNINKDIVTVPETGDNIIIYIVLLVLAIIGFILTIILEKNKKRKRPKH